VTAGIAFNQDGMPFDVPEAPPSEEGKPAEQPIRENGVMEPGDPGEAEANAAAFAPPASPHHYDVTPIYEGKEPSDEDMADQIGIQQALHAEGVPTFAVGIAVNVMAQALKDGLPDAAGLERSRSSCINELTSRHGENARQIIADASKVFQRLDARDSRIGDMLCNTGAANDPHLVETLARLWRDVYSKRT
jgi:hypothetical protein